MLHDIRWTRKKLGKMLAELKTLRFQNMLPIAPFRVQSLPNAQLPAPVGLDVDDSGWAIIQPETQWGEWNTNFVLRTFFAASPDWAKNGQAVYLYLPIGVTADFSHPEALIYIDGEPYATCDRFHQEILLAPQFLDGEPHVLALHGWPGAGYEMDINRRVPRMVMRTCALVQLNQPLLQFLRIVELGIGVVDLLDEHDVVQHRLLNALNTAYNTLNLCKPFGKEFDLTLNTATEDLMDGIFSAGNPLDVQITAAGHGHLDIGWLWPVEQGRRKAGRTFTTAVRLLEEFPEYRFAQSQPQLYKFVEEDYPLIFEEITQAVKDGRWELLGGTWVELDTNNVGSESLARQFLMGRRYFREKFGDAESPVLFLPDTFGYSGAIPQLARQAGLKYFITQKMSWNQYDRMPFQSFWWQGIDGTRILSHFLTTPGQPVSEVHGTTVLHSSSYGALLTPAEVMGTWQNFDQKETYQDLLLLYGYGDGGGGPTREMLQNLALLQQFPGLPKVKSGTVGGYMERLEQEAGRELPVWNGELYLEFHRGTLTSQARTKRANRKNEFRLHDAEFLSSYSSLMRNQPYPHERLQTAWEKLCVNQFHDILPGSSIAKVYEDAMRDHEFIEQTSAEITMNAINELTADFDPAATHVVVNPTSYSGCRMVFSPEKLEEGQAFYDLETDQALAVQPVENGTLIEIPHIDAYSLKGLGRRESSSMGPQGVTVRQDGVSFILENEYLRVELTDVGEISRLWDKQAQRDVLAPGQRGNILQAFEDRPVEYDAWDIDIYYEDKCWPIEPVNVSYITETGPLRCAVDFEHKFRGSRIIQHVSLGKGSRRLDFDTYVDWHEQQVLLKAAFPVQILSSLATFDIQWGCVQRPTHRNTSWDWARFESVAQKWVDISEGDYGVSLLNDCKYGHDVHENVLRVTLLKSATMPDPQADQGEHRFVYSLYPHDGDWRQGTIPAAYDLNDPCRIFPIRAGSGSRRSLPHLAAVDRPNVVVETIKRAEDGDGLILRLYENLRSRGKVKLSLGVPVSRACICNLLEENQEQVDLVNGELLLNFKPFEIITLRVICDETLEQQP